MSIHYQATPTQLAIAHQERLKIRHGANVPTMGLAPGMTQVNMICVPEDWAWDFLLYAQRNPQSCPVLDVIESGGFKTILGKDIDIRSDFPKYHIWENGQKINELTDITEMWEKHPKLVTFLIGCSFSFENNLLMAGIEVRHITDRTNVPMYLTNIPCRTAGKISGNLVVSMRPIPASHVSQAVQITSKVPLVHGAPVHIGFPEQLGINDIYRPDFGDMPRMLPHEIPVFWACGVTPQAAVIQSKIPFAISHAPGHMLITDIPDRRWSI
ncbi:putative hydro-lyase [Acinetobacter pollinis]|uniref:putative hydro-lyase n=1 Tax=Acinetobacter pollinis TaxID=2605270 RepID=UPI0018A25E3A|nr:putative hydro-lyase [Acinetobacter pollinis]MBF7691636.1 putative hydro-lyase [Acinetobacter pollinis]MBF7699188.1 putative hydro-lyase [Acinetobacter pollinis]